MTQNEAPSLSQAMSDWSKRDGSPCHECVVNPACRRSFIDGSACEKFVAFVEQIMIEAGVQFENKTGFCDK